MTKFYLFTYHCFILLPWNFSWNVTFYLRLHSYCSKDMHFTIIFVDKTMKTSFIDFCNVIKMVAHQVQ